jgi:hypothetical protein
MGLLASAAENAEHTSYGDRDSVDGGGIKTEYYLGGAYADY